MNIHLPPHAVSFLAGQIVFYRRERDRTDAVGYLLGGEKARSTLVGLDLVLAWLGPRQRKVLDAAIRQAMEEEPG